MINMRDGRGGFVGGFKTLVRGAFSFQYSKTSATISVNVRGNRLVVLGVENRLVSNSTEERLIKIEA